MQRTERRRFWTVPIPLTVALALAAGPGCSKVEEALGKAEEAIKDKTGEGEEAEEEEVVEQTAEEQVAEELPAAAIVEVEAPSATPLTQLDGLLELLPAEQVAPAGKMKMMMIARDAGVIFDYAEAAEKLAGPGLERMATASANNPEINGDVKEMQLAYEMGRGEVNKVMGTLKGSGIDFSKGVMLWEVGGQSYLVYNGENGNALKAIGQAFGEDMASSVCQPVDGHAGYHVCADKQAALDAYTPGGAEGAKALREAMNTHLGGVDLDKANVVGYAEKGWLSLATPPGLMVLTVALPDDADTKEFKAMFKPGAPKTLRGVQPGAGFVWANMDTAAMMAGAGGGLQGAPPQAQAAAEQFTGEVLLAGHYAPPAISLQFGVKDVSALGPIMDMAKELEPQVPKTLEQLPGSEVKYEILDVPVGDAQARAVHVGLSKIPEADVLATYTGLTLDGWAFPANDTFTVAIGASAEAIGHVADGTGDGPSDALKIYLPPALAAAAAAGEVSFIMHLPVDALHGPQTKKLVDAALKNAKETSPELITGFLSLAAPLSSATAWTTHAGDGVQVHLAMQGIGHNADDEGKAALDAAARGLAGEDAAPLFAALVDKYPDSARIPSYKARAGQTEAALVASGVGAALATAALAIPMASGERNDALASELGVEEGAAEKAAEESKADPDEKKTVKKKKKKKVTPKPEPKPEPKPTPDPTPTPEPEPTPDPKPDDKTDDSTAPVPTPVPIPPKPDDKSEEKEEEKGDSAPIRLKKAKVKN